MDGSTILCLIFALNRDKLLETAKGPTSAVILFDVFLGHGSSSPPRDLAAAVKLYKADCRSDRKRV